LARCEALPADEERVPAVRQIKIDRREGSFFLFLLFLLVVLIRLFGFREERRRSFSGRGTAVEEEQREALKERRMDYQPQAKAADGTQIRQVFVPSTGAHHYHAVTPLELVAMCRGLYEMWNRVQDMYPFTVCYVEKSVWEIDLWESRSTTAYAVMDWLKEELVICRMRTAHTPDTVAALTKAKGYLLLCEMKMAHVGVVVFQRAVRAVNVGPNQIAVSSAEWASAQTGVARGLNRRVVDTDHLPQQVPAPMVAVRARRNSF
jgi:hypothetical protein